MTRGAKAGVHASMRWTLFLLVSVAVHAALLLPSARHGASSPIELEAPFGESHLHVALFPPAAPVPASSAVEAAWTPLQPLPQYKPQGARRTRLLEFAPVDVPASEIDESAYLPITRVTLRPSPLAPILVPFPAAAEAEPAASRTAKVVVFIDEDGSVAKVTLAKDQSPSPFALAALKTFEHARYRPALLNQTPVKVRVVIAVTFEDRQAKR